MALQAGPLFPLANMFLCKAPRLKPVTSTARPLINSKSLTGSTAGTSSDAAVSQEHSFFQRKQRLLKHVPQSSHAAGNSSNDAEPPPQQDFELQPTSEADWLDDVSNKIWYSARARMSQSRQLVAAESTTTESNATSGVAKPQRSKKGTSKGRLTGQSSKPAAIGTAAAQPEPEGAGKTPVVSALHLLQNAARSQTLAMDDAMLRVALEQATLQLDALGMRGICQLSWSLGRLKSFPEFKTLTPQFQELLTAITARLTCHQFEGKDPTFRRQLTPANLCMLLFGFAEHGLQPGAAFLDAVAQYCIEKADKFKRDHVMGVIRACAQVAYNPLDGKLLDVMFDLLLVDNAVSKMSKSDILDVLEGAVRVKYTPLDLFSTSVAATLAKRLWGMSPQECCRTLIAFARLGQNPSNGMLFSKIVKKLSNRVVLRDLTPVEIGTVCWAAVMVSHKLPGGFLDALGKEALWKLPKFTPMTYTAVAYSMALNGFRPKSTDFVDRIVKRLSFSKVLSRFSPRQLSTLAWSLAVLGPLPTDFMNLLAAHAIEKLPAFTPQDCVMLASAFARLGHDPVDGMLVDAIIDHLVRRELLCQMEATSVVELVVALQSVRGQLPQAFLDEVGQAAKGNLAGWDASNVVALCKAFAGLGHDPLHGQVVDAFVQHLEEGHLQVMSRDDVRELYGAAAGLGHALPAAFERVAIEATSEVEGEITSPLGEITSPIPLASLGGSEASSMALQSVAAEVAGGGG